MERYVVTSNRETFADTPKEARYGFTTGRIDLGRGKFKDIPPEKIKKAFFVPKLCNQCAKPSCVQVCPVGATYQNVDGVVMVDRTWCIGCGYCIMACPYGMRFFHPLYQWRINVISVITGLVANLRPACVQACPTGAGLSATSKTRRIRLENIIRTQRVAVHKPEYGTNPQVYFIGLDEEVR